MLIWPVPDQHARDGWRISTLIGGVGEDKVKSECLICCFEVHWWISTTHLKRWIITLKCWSVTTIIFPWIVAVFIMPSNTDQSAAYRNGLYCCKICSTWAFACCTNQILYKLCMRISVTNVTIYTPNWACWRVVVLLAKIKIGLLCEVLPAASFFKAYFL